MIYRLSWINIFTEGALTGYQLNPHVKKKCNKRVCYMKNSLESRNTELVSELLVIRFHIKDAIHQLGTNITCIVMLQGIIHLT
jgi:hypothetical protein